MNGIKLTHLNNEINAAIEGNLTMTIKRIGPENTDLSISIDGMDKNNCYYQWYNQLFKEGESVTIEITDKEECSTPIKTRPFDENSNIHYNDDEALLNQYYELKAMLDGEKPIYY